MRENRKKYAAFRILVSLLAISLAGPLPASEPDIRTREVRCTEIAFSRSVESRDSGKFSSFLDEDARFVGATVLRGKREVVDAWAPFFEENGPQLVWRPYIVEVLGNGDLAFSRGPYRMRAVGSDGQVVESWGIYNSVWRKAADGRWTIIFDAGNQGDNLVDDPMKALIDAPVDRCDPAG